MIRPEPAPWLLAAFAIVVMITAARLVLLAFNGTDLFVDESQYWLWGQEFAFGYYSKPPLIAWLIGTVTTLAGSDDPFWIRAPGAALHGATALVLAAMAARLFDARAAIWTAATYATLPMVTLGSLLISTDTVMAPFLAAALYFHTRLVETRALRFALLAGAMAGLAFLGKYAAVYFLLGAALGALILPVLRIGFRNGGALCVAFLAVIAPNLIWNATNELTTASHILDNVGWIRQQTPLGQLNPAGLAEFFLAQFAVFGPILFAVLLWAAATGFVPRLLVFTAPPIILVCVQALLDRAYANWAAAAYLAGTVLVVGLLMSRPRWLVASLAINGVIAILMPLATVFPDTTLGSDAPLLKRYLGRQVVSIEILERAHAAGGVPVVAARRDVLADLFYTGRDAGITFYAPRSEGRPENHYAKAYPMPIELQGQILFVSEQPPCPNAGPGQPLATQGGGYDNLSLSTWLIDAACLR